MHVYIYIYIYIYIFSTEIGRIPTAAALWPCALPPQPAERNASFFGCRFSTEIYRSKRDETVFHENYRTPVLLLQKSTKVFGNLREFTG